SALASRKKSHRIVWETRIANMRKIEMVFLKGILSKKSKKKSTLFMKKFLIKSPVIILLFSRYAKENKGK
ncbi:hypothetical protein KC711_06725, partial [Candidatus Peregrinibacteria bacterium]|nr:hypothetical protein [Candidatus Peregrinibacteria bacterium]